MAWLRLAVLLGGAAVWLSATPKFVSGDLLWVGTDTSSVYRIALNASYTTGTASLIGTGNHTEYGQMAFSADAQTAYLTTWDGYILAVSASTGQVTTFASGFNNLTGLIRTQSGKLLAASYADGKIYDVTAGGTPAQATVWAYGLSSPRNMVETPTGIFVAEQGSNEVTNMGTGGNLASKAAFATVEAPTALAYYNNMLYTADGLTGTVYALAGGAVNASNYYAKGQIFASLAVGHNKLYAGTMSGTNGIWDISVTGDFKSRTAVVTGLPLANSLLSVVPDPVTVIQSEIPEPGTAIAGAALMLAGALRRRQAARRDL